MQQVSNAWPRSGPSREVRVEQWRARTFYASACRFFLDVPLDMSGIIRSTAAEAARAGYRLTADGLILATDSHLRGAVLIEIDGDTGATPNVVHLGGEMIVRALPDKGARLRAEFDELLRWSSDLGYELAGRFVQYGTLPGAAAVRPLALYAPLRGDEALL